MLSCYTTNLLGHLRRERPDIDAVFAEAVELAVRVDLPGGLLAFSQHRRVDAGLGYRAAGRWADAEAGLVEEYERDGSVLVVGNTRNLPWCPGFGIEDVPHWFRLTQRRGSEWVVLDEFEALLPHGEQRPFCDSVSGGRLEAMLSPLPPLRPEVHQRDVHALGEAVAVPPAGRYRWLSQRGDAATVPGGQWLRGTSRVLRWLAERFAEDPAALGRHTEDLWAASRHYQFRYAHDDAAVVAWGGLSRALRFAAQSAARGKARPGVVLRAFDEVVTASAQRIPS